MSGKPRNPLDLHPVPYVAGLLLPSLARPPDLEFGRAQTSTMGAHAKLYVGGRRRGLITVMRHEVLAWPIRSDPVWQKLALVCLKKPSVLGAMVRLVGRGAHGWNPPGIESEWIVPSPPPCAAPFIAHGAPLHTPRQHGLARA